MKRLALAAVVAMIASTGCASLTKGGARGPAIQRTTDSQPSTDSVPGNLDSRPDLGQR